MPGSPPRFSAAPVHRRSPRPWPRIAPPRACATTSRLRPPEPGTRHALEAEVVRLTAHGENEIVVGDRPVRGDDTLPGCIEARHLRHPELGVGLAPQDGAYRSGDLLGLEPGGRDLVE